MITRLFVVLIMLVLPHLSIAQNTYKVGSANHSIEPPSSIFSISLAGYGVPREGRFSLEWIEQKASIPYTRIFKGKKSPPQVVASRNATTIEELRQEFIILDEEGVVWKSPVGKSLLWSKLDYNTEIVDLAVSDEKLYALTTGNELLQYQSNGEWLRIAIRNGITYKQDIRQITVYKDRLYGLDSSGKIFLAQHKTDSNLTAHALSVNDGSQRAIIMSLDLCGFDWDFIKDVKEVINKKFNIPPSAILVNASHTHFGPVPQNWPTWAAHCQKPDSTYLYGTVKSAMITTISSAIKKEEKANIYFGRGATTIGANRSLKQEPVPYDKDVDVIKVVYKNGTGDDILFLHGCHPVFNQDKDGITISANFPAVTRDILSQDPKINSSMFMQGCGGDINPVDLDHRVTGRKLASAVHEVLANDLKQLSGQISYYLDSISFPVKPWSKDRIETFKQQNSLYIGDVGAEKNVRWAELMLEFIRGNSMPKKLPVYVQTINIGNWKLVGLSREVVTEYSIGIKNLFPGQMVSVAGYTNDVASYLPTRRHIQAGVYEGNESFFWYGQPSIFPETVYETIINAVKINNR